jgi:hypothetical protein
VSYATKFRQILKSDARLQEDAGESSQVQVALNYLAGRGFKCQGDADGGSQAEIHTCLRDAGSAHPAHQV